MPDINFRSSQKHTHILIHPCTQIQHICVSHTNDYTCVCSALNVHTLKKEKKEKKKLAITPQAVFYIGKQHDLFALGRMQKMILGQRKRRQRWGPTSKPLHLLENQESLHNDVSSPHGKEKMNGRKIWEA